jgi:hypothetical protein
MSGNNLNIRSEVRRVERENATDLETMIQMYDQLAVIETTPQKRAEAAARAAKFRKTLEELQTAEPSTPPPEDNTASDPTGGKRNKRTRAARRKRQMRLTRRSSRR